MFFTVTEIVFQVVASVFENIVVFVFDLPVCPPITDDGMDSLVCNLVVGSKSIVIEHFSIGSLSDGYLAPVDQ